MSTSANTDITITAAKGRPMLTWVGKRPLSTVTAFPAQHIETFDPSEALTQASAGMWTDWPKQYAQGGLLFHGDNKEVLAHLLANGFRGKVKLIYIDPPFDSGADYIRRVQLRGSASKVEGEGYALGEQIQYTDIWVNDNYLQFMFERLLLLKELLVEDGSIWLHCDWRMVHRLRLLLDEVFGADNFINEVVWKHTVLGGTHGRRLPKAHETILWYGKSQEYVFNENAKSARVPFGEYIKKTLRQDEKGRWFYSRGRMSRQPTEEELTNKASTITYVDNPEAGTLASDIWDDLPAYRVYGDEVTDYPTQKNESLLNRFIELGSSPGDIVLDCFIGSGTTAAVAQKLGRRWIGCDINKGAIQTTAKRLQSIISEQIAEQSSAVNAQQTLDGLDAMEDTTTTPAQSAFTVWRVNDYDLQIQHNEAVELACEHLGVTRTRNDSFFDGTLGNELVKIIPFGHPLSPLDLEEIRRELDARTEEDRNIVAVCLGKEYAADAWLDDWNRLRTGANAVNRIRAIELRTDPKYGKFFAHRPAEAQVTVTRNGDQLTVTVVNFVSPSICERLKLAANLLSVKIPDWRSMVDCIMIDTAYNGDIFNIILSDIPEKKTDLVQGNYTLLAPAGGSTVAVKIIDMLGEEVLQTFQVPA